MAVAIRSLDDTCAAAWDAFVLAHPDGTFFHRASWATIIERAFGHRTHYAFTERDGAITGVLPLAQVKTLLFGNTLISVPFCVYGGPLAADAESADALSAHAASLLEQTGASAVEFRYRGPNGSINGGRVIEAISGTNGGVSGVNGGTHGERDGGHAGSHVASDWLERPGLYVTFRKPIEADADVSRG